MCKRLTAVAAGVGRPV